MAAIQPTLRQKPRIVDPGLSLTTVTGQNRLAVRRANPNAPIRRIGTRRPQGALGMLILGRASTRFTTSSNSTRSAEWHRPGASLSSRRVVAPIRSRVPQRSQHPGAAQLARL